MNRVIFHATGCCLALALAACDKPDQAAQPDDPGNAASLPAPPASVPPSPTLANKDQAFIANAAGDNAFQIAMARLALRKSQSAKVHALAQRIMDDHTRMNNELAAIATRRATDHASPAVPVDKARQLQDHLAMLQGSAFDQAFAGVLVNDHYTAIELFSSEVRTGHDEAVRSFA
jgi:putative membrane protein